MSQDGGSLPLAAAAMTSTPYEVTPAPFKSRNRTSTSQ